MRRGALLGAVIAALAAALAGPAAPGAAKEAREGAVAQVFQVKGPVFVTAAGAKKEVKPGTVLGREDVLSLEKDAEVSLYFKQGGRRDIKAGGEAMEAPVATLMTDSGAYKDRTNQFGASRGGELPGSKGDVTSFYFHYPGEPIILDQEPVVELVFFYEPEKIGIAPESTIMILDEDDILLSQSHVFTPGVPFRCSSEKLESGREYTLLIKMKVPSIQERSLMYSTPIYLSMPTEGEAASVEDFFGDATYRSVEYSTMYRGTGRYQMLFIKQLKPSADGQHQVVSAEMFLM